MQPPGAPRTGESEVRDDLDRRTGFRVECGHATVT